MCELSVWQTARCAFDSHEFAQRLADPQDTDHTSDTNGSTGYPPGHRPHPGHRWFHRLPPWTPTTPRTPMVLWAARRAAIEPDAALPAPWCEMAAKCCNMASARTWELGAGTWALGPGHWDLVAGSWALGPGHWDLGIGTWSAPRERPQRAPPAPRALPACRTACYHSLPSTPPSRTPWRQA